MTLKDFLADSVGLTLVHWDAAESRACFWNGRYSFFEYRFADSGEVTHGDVWSTRRRLECSYDAVDAANAHYAPSPG